jgi:hypothetical protein
LDGDAQQALGVRHNVAFRLGVLQILHEVLLGLCKAALE